MRNGFRCWNRLDIIVGIPRTDHHGFIYKPPDNVNVIFTFLPSFRSTGSSDIHSRWHLRRSMSQLQGLSGMSFIVMFHQQRLNILLFSRWSWLSSRGKVSSRPLYLPQQDWLPIIRYLAIDYTIYALFPPLPIPHDTHMFRGARIVRVSQRCFRRAVCRHVLLLQHWNRQVSVSEVWSWNMRDVGRGDFGYHLAGMVS